MHLTLPPVHTSVCAPCVPPVLELPAALPLPFIFYSVFFPSLPPLPCSFPACLQRTPPPVPLLLSLFFDALLPPLCCSLFAHTCTPHVCLPAASFPLTPLLLNSTAIVHCTSSHPLWGPFTSECLFISPPPVHDSLPCAIYPSSVLPGRTRLVKAGLVTPP